MLQITPQMRVLVAVEPADFRAGIDGMARRCRDVLNADPMSGAMFVFRNRSATAIKALVYDGRGFWLCHLRLSSSRFRHWPRSACGSVATELESHELSVLLAGGNPSQAVGVPQWRRVRVPA